MLYQVVKKLKSDKGLFKFQLSSDLLGQEMECIIDAADIMQFATMQEISANYIMSLTSMMQSIYWPKRSLDN